LFCCAGGASVGYARAGFDVVGVDIKPQPNYPFEFYQADALTFPLDGFDIVHASPPCQRFSDLAKRNKNAHKHPDYIFPIRHRLAISGLPYIIENVEGAPISQDLLLCGTMFPGLRVLRHRKFEMNFSIEQPKHDGKHPLVYTLDKRKPHYKAMNQDTDFVMVNGGGNCSIEAASSAMGIDWMTKNEINEAIPPAYTEYIGREIIGAFL